MVLRNLHSEYPQYNEEHVLIKYSYHKDNSTREKGRHFWEKMNAGTATVGDWVGASDVNIQDELLKLEQAERKVVEKLRIKLFDWWLEFKVQENIMRDWDKVIRYAPDEIKHYAAHELAELIRFTTGKMDRPDEFMYALKRNLSYEIKFSDRFTNMEQGGYLGCLNIHDKEGTHEIEALLRYKGYLLQIIETGIQIPEVEDRWNDELSFLKLWPEFYEFSQNLTVGFTIEKIVREKKEHLYFHVHDVSGAEAGYSLKHYITSYFQIGFERLLHQLEQHGRERRMSVLYDLKFSTEWFATQMFIFKDEYVEKDAKDRPVKYRQFNRFNSLKYKGNDAFQLVFDEHLRVLLDIELDELGFVKGWIEGVQEAARKLENMYNNLELLTYRIPPSYDVDRIFENVFVLESEEAAIQCTAFHLKDIGIVTCDHCIRNPETGMICTDLLLFRRNFHKKMEVRVLKSHANLDVAILVIVSERGEFLAEGLTLGSSEDLNQLDAIGVAGFPHYNLGDQGYFANGKITGFKKISSIQYILVDCALVAGNSGGPGLDANGNVIGIVNIGADNFQNAKGTEKHGLLPIEVLQLLK